MKNLFPNAFQRFVTTEARGGFVLLLSACIALLIANSAWTDAYTRLLGLPIAIGIGPHSISLALRDWINDGLMAVFFLLVGLEIKRELIAGELSSFRQAALPIAAAIGGMIVPAALYLLVNINGPGLRGWAIPMATDIAFALGALALLAPRAPIAAKVFLTALAIVDDMGAVLIIGFFYSETIVWTAVGGAIALALLLIVFNATGVRRIWPYLLAGVGLWFFVHESGIHATIAGIILAFTIPTRTRINAQEFSHQARGLLDEFDRSETGDLLVLTSKGQQETLFTLEQASEGVTAPILKLEHVLHNFSAFAVMPLFAFANAGISIAASQPDLQILFGVLAGLIVGKPLGVMAAAYLAVKFRVAKLPEGVGWSSLHGYAWLAGIGFTMSLFIAMLAFDDAALLNAAKIGILSGSLLAGAIAAISLRLTRKAFA